MRLSFNRGLSVHSKESTVQVDAQKAAVGSLCVTHAHSDHINGLGPHAHVFSTPQTKSLIQAAAGKNAHASWTTLNFNQDHVFDDGLTLSLQPSGHILGSAQALFTHDQSVLVSSDLLLQDHPFWPAPKIPSCDTLLIESTFGLPSFSFPSRDDVFQKIRNWASREITQQKVVVLSGYSLGKAQELIWFCNEHLDITPFVAEPIAAFNHVYQEHHIPIGDFELLNGNGRDAQVIILPPNWVKPDVLSALSFSTKKKISSALCTGWSRPSRVFDQLFPLSDHADFESLLEVVKLSGAKKVYTMHGFEAEFAKTIRQRLGISASPLQSLHPHSLASFLQDAT